MVELYLNKKVRWSLKIIAISILLVSIYLIWIWFDLDAIICFFPKIKPIYYHFYVAAVVGLLVFIAGQIIIPLFKYIVEVRSRRRMLIIMMNTIVNRVLGDKKTFTPGRINRAIIENAFYDSINTTLKKVKADSKYIAYIYSGSDDPLVTKLLHDDRFWLMGKETTRLFSAYAEAAARVDTACAVSIDVEYRKIAKDNHERYIGAIKQVRNNVADWIKSAIELKIHLNGE